MIVVVTVVAASLIARVSLFDCELSEQFLSTIGRGRGLFIEVRFSHKNKPLTLT